MTLGTKFARLCRLLLTPVRKYLITKKIKSRINANIGDNIFYNTKYVLAFTHALDKNGKRPFGIVVACSRFGSFHCFILRCGCFHQGNLSQALSEHAGITSHGKQFFYRYKTDLKPTIKLKTNIHTIPSSGVFMSQETTIIKPKRAVRKGTR